MICCFGCEANVQWMVLVSLEFSRSYSRHYCPLLTGIIVCLSRVDARFAVLVVKLMCIG